jgi:hypothetical protein
MDGAVQQNAVAVQRNAAASEKLKRDARELAHTVSRFKLPEDESPGESLPDTAREGDDSLPAPPLLLLRTPRP